MRKVIIFFQVAFCCVISYQLIASEANMIDNEKLLEYRKKTAISGVYLKVWINVHEHLRKNSKIKLEEYIINFDENDGSFLVTLSKPFSEPVLGGGVGTCTVDKNTQDVKCKLIK